MGVQSQYQVSPIKQLQNRYEKANLKTAIGVACDRPTGLRWLDVLQNSTYFVLVNLRLSDSNGQVLRTSDSQPEPRTDQEKSLVQSHLWSRMRLAFRAKTRDSLREQRNNRPFPTLAVRPKQPSSTHGDSQNEPRSVSEKRPCGSPLGVACDQPTGLRKRDTATHTAAVANLGCTTSAVK